MQRHADSAFEAVSDIMKMWGWIVAYTDWDLHWFVLLSSICRQTYQTRSDEWQRYLLDIFSHVLHAIDLPVGPSKIHIFGASDSAVTSAEGYPFFSSSSFVLLPASRSKTLQLLHKAAKLIIYLLIPGGGEPMRCLKQLVTAVESFLHPSNNGYWTLRLSQLLSSLCKNFSERIAQEKSLPDGAACKLLPSDITAFAQTMLPLALQGLYSKNSTATLHACTALKYIGFLDLNTTAPPLLERIFRALTTLTEVHQTSSALEALASVIFPILRGADFAAGARHIPDLMEMTLSGIDANDLPKTWATLRFYTVLLSGLPLLQISGDVPPGADPERHDAARQVSDAFADWAFRFLDQTLAFIQNHCANPQHDEPNKADSETRTSEYFFHCTLEVFFMQLGDDLYQSALVKVATFCFTNYFLPQQQTQLGVILAALTAVNPGAVVKQFIPVCLRKLLISPGESSPAGRGPLMRSPTWKHANGSLNSPASARQTPSEERYATLHGMPYQLAVLSEQEIVYYLAIMKHIADQAGDALLPYKDKIHAVIDLALKVEERSGVTSLLVFKMVNKFVRSLMHSLVTCRLKEYKSVPPSKWNDKSWQQTHYKSWGSVVEMNDETDFQWRTPSKEGLQWAADLACRYMQEPIACLRLYLTSQDDTSNGVAAHADGEQQLLQQRKRKAASRDDTKVSNAEWKGNFKRRLAGLRAANTGSSIVDIRNMVLQLRFVLEGIAASLPYWSHEGRTGNNSSNGSTADTSTHNGSGQNGNVRSNRPRAGREEYADGTYELPAASTDACEGLNCINAGGKLLQRDEIAQLLAELVTFTLEHRSEDMQLLKALGRCVDVCMNGVDILERQAQRMQLRYSIMKARNRETAKDGMGKALPRYMLAAKLYHQYLTRVMMRGRKSATSPLIATLVAHVHELSTYAYSGVRSQGSLALLSVCRRYEGACAFSLPRLVELIQDQDSEAPGHDQRVVGATTLLQTQFFQSRIIRDWVMMRRFLLSVCQSDHNDKDIVLDALDSLFTTFLQYWYQISLTIPPYTNWDRPSTWDEADLKFNGYAEVLDKLAELLTVKANMHWSYKLMVVDAVTVMVRDDVATPISVWRLLLDGMVSDISHVREACYPALCSALELMQTRKVSKDDSDGQHKRFPDKPYVHWNGSYTPVRIDDFTLDIRKSVITDEYVDQVRELLLGYFEGENGWVGRLTAALGIIQLGRAKGFVASHAQMFKGLFKQLGPRILRALEPFLDRWVTFLYV